MPITGPVSSLIALIAASLGVRPSRCSATFSTMMMASSTTMPMARMSANSVIRLMLNQHRHGGKRADDRHRHRRRRHQHRPQVLQENHDNDQYENPRLDQRVVDGGDRLLNKFGRIVYGGICHPGRERLAHFLDRRQHLFRHLQIVGAGQGIEEDVRGILAEDLRKAGEGLLAELDARQILDANDLRRLAAVLLTMMFWNSSTSESRPRHVAVNWKAWSDGTGGPPSCPPPLRRSVTGSPAARRAW